MTRASIKPGPAFTAATMDTCSRTLKLLADETRLAIVGQLLAGPRHVHEINSELNIDATLLSHHLRVLRDAGLICAGREGRSVVYRLAPELRLVQRRRTLDFGCCELRFRGSSTKRTKGAAHGPA